jgi:hypothetical protein
LCILVPGIDCQESTHVPFRPSPLLHFEKFWGGWKNLEPRKITLDSIQDFANNRSRRIECLADHRTPWVPLPVSILSQCNRTETRAGFAPRGHCYMPKERMKSLIKQDVARPIPSISSQVITISVALIVLVFCVHGSFLLIEDLITGRTYALTVVFGDSTMIYKISSPTAYWATMGFYLSSCAAGIILGILMPIAVIAERKKATAAAEEESQAEDVTS